MQRKENREKKLNERKKKKDLKLINYFYVLFEIYFIYFNLLI